MSFEGLKKDLYKNKYYFCENLRYNTKHHFEITIISILFLILFIGANILYFEILFFPFSTYIIYIIKFVILLHIFIFKLNSSDVQFFLNEAAKAPIVE